MTGSTCCATIYRDQLNAPNADVHPTASASLMRTWGPAAGVLRPQAQRRGPVHSGQRLHQARLQCPSRIDRRKTSFGDRDFANLQCSTTARIVAEEH